MLKREHSAKLSTFIKLPFVIKIFVLSIFERPFYTGSTVHGTTDTNAHILLVRCSIRGKQDGLAVAVNC